MKQFLCGVLLSALIVFMTPVGTLASPPGQRFGPMLSELSTIAPHAPFMVGVTDEKPVYIPVVVAEKLTGCTKVLFNTCGNRKVPMYAARSYPSIHRQVRVVTRC